MNWVKDYKEIEYPVGWLAPNGEWFLLDDSLGKAYHFKASAELVVQQECKAYGDLPEKVLEHEGYVKIRKSEIRYLANFPYHGYYDQVDPRTPDITKEQQEELYKFIEYAFKKFGYIDINGYCVMINLNGRIVRDFTCSQFRQMDMFALRKLFSLDTEDLFKKK